MAYLGSPFTFDSRIPDPGTTDQVLKSDGAGNWTTADPGHLNLPSGALDEVLTHDGTNWVSAVSAGGGGGSTEAIATGALSDGQSVILKSDGTVEIVSNPIGYITAPLADDGSNTRTQAHNSTNAAQYQSVDFDPNDPNKFVIIYRDVSQYVMAASVGTISGSTISFPLSPFIMPWTAHGYAPKVKYHPSTMIPGTPPQSPLIAIGQADGMNGMKIILLSYGGSSGLFIIGSGSSGMTNMPSSGMPMDYYGAYTMFDWDTAYTGSGNATNRFLLSWEANHDPVMGSSTETYLMAGTCADNGGSVAFGTVGQADHMLQTNNGSNIGTNTWERPIAFDPNTAGKFAYVQPVHASQDMQMRIGTISGTTITLGTAVKLDASGGADRYSHSELMWNTAVSDLVLISWCRDNHGDKPAIAIATVSGTTLTIGAPLEIHTSGYGVKTPWRIMEFLADKIFAVGYINTQGMYGALFHQAFSWTGTTISAPYTRTEISHPTNLVTTQSESNFAKTPQAASTGSKILAFYYQGLNPSNDPVFTQSTFYGSAGTNLTATNFLGISDDAYASGATATIQLPGAVDDAQSGLTIGTKYYLQGDGVLSATANTPEVLVGTAVGTTKILLADSAVLKDITLDRTAATAAITAHQITRVAAEATVLSSAATDATTKANAAQASAQAAGVAAAYAVDTLQIVASGSLANGNKVILQADGKVKLVANNPAPLDTPTTDTQSQTMGGRMDEPTVAQGSSQTDQPQQKAFISWDPLDENRFIIGYKDENAPVGTGYPRAVVGTISGTTITLGTPVDITTDNDSSPVAIHFHPDVADLVAIAYGADYMGTKSPILTFGMIENAPTARFVPKSSLNMHLGASYGSSVPHFEKGNFCFDWDRNSSGSTREYACGMDVWFDYSGAVNYRMPVLRAGKVTVDATTITPGSATWPRGLFTAGNYQWGGGQIKSLRFDPNTHKKFFWIHHYPSGGGGIGHALRIVNLDSNNYPSLGSEIQLTGQGVDNSDDGAYCEWNPAIANQIVFSGKTYNPATMCVGTVSGTSVSWGTRFTPTATDWEASHPGYTAPSQPWNIFFALGAAQGRFYGVTTAFSSSADLICQAFNITGTTITEVGSPVTIADHDWFDNTLTYPWHAAASASGRKFMVSHTETTGDTQLTTGTIGSEGVTNLTVDNFLGISDGVYADGATATIQLSGATDDAQSGLTTGSTYYIQPNGSLATTSGTPSVFAGTALSATELLIAATRPGVVGSQLPLPGTTGKILTSDGTNWTSGDAPVELPTAGVAGKVLKSDGTNWISGDEAELPTPGLAGYVLKSDGTNWVSNAETDPGLPVAGTAGKLLTSDGTNWTSADAVPGSGRFEAVASGALADGDRVILRSDGKVEHAIPQGALGVSTDAQGTALQGVNGDIRNDRWGSTIDFDPNDDNKFVVGYWDSSGATGTYLQMVVGTLTGTTISWGTPVDIETAAPQGGSMISFKFHPTQANLIGAVYGTDGTGATQTNGAHFGVATVTGTSLSWYPLLDFEAGQDCSGGSQQGTPDATFSFDWDSQFTGTGFRCAWQNEFAVGGTSGEKLHNAGSAIISPVGAGPHTLTASTTAYRLDNRTYTGGVVRIRSCRFDPFTEGKFFATFANHNGGEPRMVIIELASNATTMTKGSAIQIHFGIGSTEGSENDHYMEWNPNRQNQLLFSFRRKNANYTETPELVLGTVAGTGVTFGSLFVLDSGQGWNYGGASPVQISWDPNDADKFFGVWSPASGASYYSQTINAQRFLLTGSGTTITADGTPTEMTPGPENGHTWNSNSGYEKFTAALNASGTKLMVNHMFDGDGSSSGGYVAGSGKTKFTTGAVNIAGTPNITTTNYIGISDGAYADAATATIQTGGAIDDAQSGLTPGSVYYLQSDASGTLSTTADTPSVIAGTALSATELLIADGVGTSAGGGGGSGAVESLSSLVEKYPTGSTYPLPAQTIAVGTDKLLLSETFLQTGELTVNGVLRLGKLFEEETPTGVTLITGGFNVVGSGTLTNAQPLVSNYDDNFLDNKTGDLDLGVNITNRATGVLGAGVDLSATTGTLTSSHVIGTDVTGVLGSGITGQPTIAGTNFTGTINTAVQDNITRVGAVVAGSIENTVTGGGGLTDGSSLTSLDSISKGAIESGGTSAHGVNPVYPAYLSTSTTGAAKVAEDASGTRIPMGLGWDYLGLVRYEGGWMYGTNDSPHLLKVPLSYGLATSSKHRYSQYMIKIPGISCYALNDRLGMQMWIQQMNTASSTSPLSPSIVFNAAAKAGAKHAYCATTLKTDGTSTIMSSQNGDIVPVQAFTAGSGQGSSVFDHYKTQITIFIDNAQVGGGRCRQPPRFHWIACSNYGADPYYDSPNYVTENLYGQYTTGMCTLATTDGQYNHGADMWKQAYNYQFAAIEFRGLSAPNNSGSAILQQGLQTRFKHAQFPLSDMTVHGPGYQSFVHTHSNPMGGMGEDTIGEGAYLYGLRNGIAENTSSTQYTHYGVGYGFDGA